MAAVTAHLSFLFHKALPSVALSSFSLPSFPAASLSLLDFSLYFCGYFHGLFYINQFYLSGLSPTPCSTHYLDHFCKWPGLECHQQIIFLRRQDRGKDDRHIFSPVRQLFSATLEQQQRKLVSELVQWSINPTIKHVIIKDRFEAVESCVTNIFIGMQVVIVNVYMDDSDVT